MSVEQAYRTLFTGMLIALSVTLLLCLVRAIIGPRIADRIVSVNMIGTQVIVAIATLAILLSESWLADFCIIYAMLSFIGVVVLTKVYMGVHAEHERRKKQDGEETR